MSRLTTSPFVVLVDTREQLPYTFAGLRADANEGGGPLTVQTVRTTLQTGDYSIAGYQELVCVERKTAADVFATLTVGRKRFRAEIERMRNFSAAWIVIEAELSDLCKGVPFAQNVSPRTIFRTAMHWQLRYPSIHWWCVPGPAFGAAVTYQLLRTWWRERVEAPEKLRRRNDRERWASLTAAGTAGAACPEAEKGALRREGGK